MAKGAKRAASLPASFQTGTGAKVASSTGKDIKSWVDSSRYDLETGRALLQSRRYLHVLFMCQQSLEKLLKAHVMEKTAELPPRVHNLVRLAEVVALSLEEEEKGLLERLSLYYIQSRYPPDIQDLTKKGAGPKRLST